MKGFKDVNSAAALKTAVTVAHKRSQMKDSSTQTLPTDKVDIIYRVFQNT